MNVSYFNFQTDLPPLPFRAIRIRLSPDNQDTQALIQRAKNRLDEICFNKADSSGESREPDEMKYKSFAGLIVEQVCWEILNMKNKNPNVIIELDQSNTPIDQIDLRIKKYMKTKEGQTRIEERTIEVRASFPHHIRSAINKNFDVIGPYQNPIKNQSEIEKDFYLRFLFELDYSLRQYVVCNKEQKIHYPKTSTNLLKQVYFDEKLNLKKDLFIYFVGGATKEMMADQSIAYLGKMASENFNQNENAIYKNIKIKNSLDSIAILRLVLGIHYC